MTQIYVSYASKDRGVALRIIKAIQWAGLNVWDEHAISMENSIEEELRHGLLTSQCVVVLWSNAAAEAQWVRQEIELAVQAWASDRLVLAVLDDTPLPIGLRDLSPISIRGVSDSGTKHLIERAAAIVRRESPQPIVPRESVLSRQTPAPSIDAPQVFVSYSRQDGQTVERLVQQIEQLGYAVWTDRQSTGPQRYAAAIVRAIRTSRLVALMCSRNAFTSDHVIREVYVAGDYKKPFLVFQLDPTEFPDEILYFISGFPRLPVAAVNSQQLRSEIARLVAA